MQPKYLFTQYLNTHICLEMSISKMKFKNLNWILANKQPERCVRFLVFKSLGTNVRITGVAYYRITFRL